MMQMEMLYAMLNGIFGQKGAVSFDRASEGGDSHFVSHKASPLMTS